MILYHGSYMSVEKPDISHSRDNVDFGNGFYTTPLREQAVRWASRFKRKYGQRVVSSYNLHEPAMRESSSVLEFDTYSDEWLDCILSCRRGNDIGSSFDVVIGGVANDKVFNTIELFFDGLIEKAEAIRRLQYEKPNLQYCFRSQPVIDRFLTFISSEALP
jgi:hypothetical protein